MPHCTAQTHLLPLGLRIFSVIQNIQHFMDYFNHVNNLKRFSLKCKVDVYQLHLDEDLEDRQPG